MKQQTSNDANIHLIHPIDDNWSDPATDSLFGDFPSLLPHKIKATFWEIGRMKSGNLKSDRYFIPRIIYLIIKVSFLYSANKIILSEEWKFFFRSQLLHKLKRIK